MNAVGTRGDGGEGVGDREAPIVVAVPIDANLLTARLHDLVDRELNEIERAGRSGVADGIAQNNRTSPATDGSGVEALHGVRVGADRVFGDVHGGQAVIDCELHSFLGGALEVVDGPVLNQAADGAGAEERSRFDGDPDTL